MAGEQRNEGGTILGKVSKCKCKSSKVMEAEGIALFFFL